MRLSICCAICCLFCISSIINAMDTDFERGLIPATPGLNSMEIARTFAHHWRKQTKMKPSRRDSFSISSDDESKMLKINEPDASMPHRTMRTRAASPGEDVLEHALASILQQDPTVFDGIRKKYQQEIVRPRPIASYQLGELTDEIFHDALEELPPLTEKRLEQMLPNTQTIVPQLLALGYEALMQKHTGAQQSISDLTEMLNKATKCCNKSILGKQIATTVVGVLIGVGGTYLGQEK